MRTIAQALKDEIDYPIKDGKIKQAHEEGF